MLPVSLNDTTLENKLHRLPPDGLSIFTLEADAVRGALVSGTTMVARMRAAHQLGILETLVLGQAYLGAALLSATIKDGDRLAIKVDGDGPARGFLVETTATGKVRGRLFVPAIDLNGPPTSLDTAPLIGTGQLSITRYMAGKTTPVTGTTIIKTGRLAQDLAWYYHISEQTPTSFSIGVHFDSDGRVAGAGGLYLQAMPGTRDEVLDRVERLVYGLPPLGQTFASGATRLDICLRSFPFFDFNMLDERPVAFDCPCTKQRLGSYIAALPLAELADMAANGPFPVEVACHNCGSIYQFDALYIQALAKRRQRQRQADPSNPANPS
jgi:molecular chaperone Hsp33